MLLSPLVLFSMHTLSGLQKGNIQLTVIALSMLAMVCFERRRWAAGGALLAFTTVSKLFPGLLVLYLLARRQWRALTAAMGIAYALATLLTSAGRRSGASSPISASWGEAFRHSARAAVAISSSAGPGVQAELFGVPA
jgi:hypothetical protein